MTTCLNQFQYGSIFLLATFVLVQCKSNNVNDASGNTATDSIAKPDSGTPTEFESPTDTEIGTNSDTGVEVTESSTDTASTTDSETASINELSTVLMIDDFEDGDHISLLGNYWFVYNDNAEGGLSDIAITKNKNNDYVMDGEGYESEWSMSLQYSFDQGELTFVPYVGWGLNMGQGSKPFDASIYGGITYTYKGSAHSVSVETLNVEDYNFYRVPVAASDGWRTVELPFSLFAQEEWGAVQTFDLDKVNVVGFQARGETGDTGSVLLDNLAFLGTDDVKPVANLVVHEPEIPEKNTLNDVSIDNPLQTLAMNALTKGANLTNWLEERPFESYQYGEAYVNALAAHGFLSLRLPIDLDLYIAQRDAWMAGTVDFEVTPQLFEILDNFEAWTANAGLSLTIDFHQYDKSLDIYNAHYVDSAVALWTAVATHFSQNTRDDIFYELMNEPELAAGVDAVDQDDYSLFAQQLVNAIRSVDARHVILFGDVNWNGRDVLIRRQPFDDDRIIYVFHQYLPFAFTHQGAPWTGLGTTRRLPWPYSTDRWSEYAIDFGYTDDMDQWLLDDLHRYHKEANLNWLYNSMVDVKKWAVDHNVPVICNEFGVYPRTVLKDDMARYYTDVISVFEALEIPWQIWFLMVDTETLQIDATLQQALGLNSMADQ